MAELLYGINAVQEAFAGRRPLIELLVRPAPRSPRLEALLDQARLRHLPIRELERPELDRLADGGVHQGVALRVGSRPQRSLEGLLEELQPPGLILVLDSITDPHNFGAILRNADAAGCSAVVVAKDRSCPLNATVAKSSAGALEHVEVCQVTNLARALEQLKAAGFWVYGLAADPGSQSLYGADLTGSLALVIGSEGKGLRPNVRSHCDALLAIPMRGRVGSLNASVASAVALFEAVRQRG